MTDTLQVFMFVFLLFQIIAFSEQMQRNGEIFFIQKDILSNTINTA